MSDLCLNLTTVACEINCWVTYFRIHFAYLFLDFAEIWRKFNFNSNWKRIETNDFLKKLFFGKYFDYRKSMHYWNMSRE